MNATETSTTGLIMPCVADLSEGTEKDLSVFINELFPLLFQLSDDLEKLLASYCFNQQAIHALLSEGEQVSDKELCGLAAIETWMNREADNIQKRLDDVISWSLKNKSAESVDKSF